MGQTLSEPVTAKESASCSDERYSVGSSSMQGWRINMEDAHTHLLELPDDPTAAFFAVFDGHGGARIAKYASQNLHRLISNSSSYAEGRISDALIEGFLKLDEEMLEKDEIKDEMSGSTAVAVLIKDNFIYCANAGDSRAVTSVSGRAVALSTDHKPCNEEESRRIFAAGGWVEFNRVNGNLALSRALGDFGFKKNDSKSMKEQIVTACPEVEIHAITAEHEFILLACDGIWDVMSNQEAVSFCRERLICGSMPEKVCEGLLDKCLAPDCELSGLGCDNMTAILVCLLQNHSVDEYLKQLRESTTTKPDDESEDGKKDCSSLIRQEHESSDSDEPDETIEEVFSTPSHSPPPAIQEREKPKLEENSGEEKEEEQSSSKISTEEVIAAQLVGNSSVYECISSHQMTIQEGNVEFEDTDSKGPQSNFTQEMIIETNQEKR